MRITPIEMKQREFKTRYKGYDKDEVHAFIELIAEEMTDFFRENALLKDEARKIADEMKEYEELEVALRDTLVKTQQMVKNCKANAETDVERFRKEAESDAEEILKGVHQNSVGIHEEITHMKGIRQHFKQEMRKLIKSSLERLDLNHGYKY